MSPTGSLSKGALRRRLWFGTGISQPVLILGGQGYIGSAVAGHLQASCLLVRSVDLGLRGEHGPVPNSRRGYQDLAPAELEEYGSIVLLAGHSSVSACDRSPREAFANNVAGFVDLVHKLRGQKLIFASSISVYVDTAGMRATEAEPLPEPVSYYDLHKQTIERYASLAYPNSFALRFGTVSGVSPNIRSDLLLNSLVQSALTRGRIEVANRQVHRPLLGVRDLCRAIEAIVQRTVPSGCYNVASTNVQIGEVADYIAERFNVACREVTRPNNYDIQVDTDKLCASADFEFHDDVPALVNALESFYTGSAALEGALA
jgi:nucleoside-diphosphate-sugar epimerase